MPKTTNTKPKSLKSWDEAVRFPRSTTKGDPRLSQLIMRFLPNSRSIAFIKCYAAQKDAKPYQKKILVRRVPVEVFRMAHDFPFAILMENVTPKDLTPHKAPFCDILFFTLQLHVIVALIDLCMTVKPSIFNEAFGMEIEENPILAYTVVLNRLIGTLGYPMSVRVKIQSDVTYTLSATNVTETADNGVTVSMGSTSLKAVTETYASLVSDLIAGLPVPTATLTQRVGTLLKVYFSTRVKTVTLPDCIPNNVPLEDALIVSAEKARAIGVSVPDLSRHIPTLTESNPTMKKSTKQTTRLKRRTIEIPLDTGVQFTIRFLPGRGMMTCHSTPHEERMVFTLTKLSRTFFEGMFSFLDNSVLFQNLQEIKASKAVLHPVETMDKLKTIMTQVFVNALVDAMVCECPELFSANPEFEKDIRNLFTSIQPILTDHYPSEEYDETVVLTKGLIKISRRLKSNSSVDVEGGFTDKENILSTYTAMSCFFAEAVSGNNSKNVSESKVFVKNALYDLCGRYTAYEVATRIADFEGKSLDMSGVVSKGATVPDDFELHPTLDADENGPTSALAADVVHASESQNSAPSHGVLPALGNDMMLDEIRDGIIRMGQRVYRLRDTVSAVSVYALTCIMTELDVLRDMYNDLVNWDGISIIIEKRELVKRLICLNRLVAFDMLPYTDSNVAECTREFISYHDTFIKRVD